MRLLLLLAAPAWATIPAAYGVIEHRFTGMVAAGEAPRLTLQAPKAEVLYVVQCTAGEQTLEWESGVVPQGEDRVFVLQFDDAEVRSAECGLTARMANGLSEKKAITLEWTVEPKRASRAADAPAPDDAEAPESVVTPKGAEDEG